MDPLIHRFGRSPRGSATRAGAGRVRALAVLALCVVAATASACGSSSPAQPTRAGLTTTLGTRIRPVSMRQINAAIDTLYRTYPSITSFAVQDVQYTPTTRDKVLQVCHHGGQAADPQTQESNRVLACGPLIYYYYSYGTQHSVPQSVAVADDLFSYAATSIHGPFDAATTLGTLLRGWGVPLAPSATTTKSAPPATSPQTTLLAAARAGILRQSSVHLRLAESTKNTAGGLTILGDLGTHTATESIRGSGARVRLRLTRTDAYLSGNPSGLTRLYGISPADATSVGTRWIDIRHGSREYADLARESTLVALADGTLPAATATATITTRTVRGTLVYVLTWSAPRTTGQGTIRYTLELAATGDPLPVRETSSTGGTRQVTTFSHWNEPIRVAAPAGTIPFVALGR